jgi:hypothetical protein
VKVGTRFDLHRQRYFCVGTKEHETRDGRWLQLLRLETDCPDCGETFRLLTTKTNARKRILTRRCEDCRRPGIPVEPQRRAPAMAKGKKMKKARGLRRRKPGKPPMINKEARWQRGSFLALNPASPAQDAPAPSQASTIDPAAVIEAYMAALSMI